MPFLVFIIGLATTVPHAGIGFKVPRNPFDKERATGGSSGGAGGAAHFFEVFRQTGTDAALAASIFHYRDCTVREVKQYLREKGIPVRI